MQAAEHLHSVADAKNRLVVGQKSPHQRHLDGKAVGWRVLGLVAVDIPFRGELYPPADTEKTVEFLDDIIDHSGRIGDAEGKGPGPVECGEVTLRGIVTIATGTGVLVHDHRDLRLAVHCFPTCLSSRFYAIANRTLWFAAISTNSDGAGGVKTSGEALPSETKRRPESCGVSAT